MGFGDKLTNFRKNVGSLFDDPKPEPKPDKAAQLIRQGYVRSPIRTRSWDGEKNYGEAGPVINYVPDFARLSLRSWEAYATNDIVVTIINKYVKWMVSSGLKLQANPEVDVLESEGIRFDAERFEKTIESRFRVWSKSKIASYNNEQSFVKLQKEAFKNAKISGDVLTILSYVKGKPTVQLVDGLHVRTPLGYNEFTDLENGNRIRSGVELDSMNRQVAYHVCVGLNKFKRVPAYTGKIRTAFLYYGSTYKIDTVRGLPAIAVSLEKLKKLDRYSEATVAGAESRANIVMAIVHDSFSTGENPQLQKMVQASGSTMDLPEDSYGNDLSDKMTAETNNQVYNMPVGSKLEAPFDGRVEQSYKEFISSNADIICAAFGIPPNVAYSLYTDSFSASRAATKDWDHTMTVDRDDMSDQWLKRVYEFFVYAENINGKLSMPGFLSAYQTDNRMVIDSYLNCRFVGPQFPHIDPEKEANAARLRLGPLADNAPLSNLEQETEGLNGGDYKDNVKRMSKELEMLVDLPIQQTDNTTD